MSQWMEQFDEFINQPIIEFGMNLSFTGTGDHLIMAAVIVILALTLILGKKK